MRFTRIRGPGNGNSDSVVTKNVGLDQEIDNAGDASSAACDRAKYEERLQTRRADLRLRIDNLFDGSF